MTDRKIGGGPAFPYEKSYADAQGHDWPVEFHTGMTLWDWFAAHSPPMPTEWLAAFIRDNPIYQHERKAPDGWLAANAAWSARYADAMLAMREETGG